MPADCREEDRGHQHVDRQACAARGEGHQQRGQDPVARARQDPGRRDGWHVAPEPDDQRQERPARKADRPHEAVGDDGRAGHVPAVLEQGQQGEHDRHQRNEGQEHADAGDEPVDDEAAHPGVLEPDGLEDRHRESRDRAAEQPVERILQRGRDRRGQLEHRPHEDEEGDRSQDRRQGHRVEPVGPAHATGIGADHRRGHHAVDPCEALVRAGHLVGAERGGQRTGHGCGQRRVHSGQQCRAVTAMPRVHQHDRHAGRLCQRLGVDAQAVPLGDVAHRQGEHEPLVGLAQLAHEVQRARQPSGVGDHDDELWPLVRRRRRRAAPASGPRQAKAGRGCRPPGGRRRRSGGRRPRAGRGPPRRWCRASCPRPGALRSGG